MNRVNKCLPHKFEWMISRWKSLNKGIFWGSFLRQITTSNQDILVNNILGLHLRHYLPRMSWFEVVILIIILPQHSSVSSGLLVDVIDSLLTCPIYLNHVTVCDGGDVCDGRDKFAVISLKQINASSCFRPELVWTCTCLETHQRFGPKDPLPM